MSNFHELSDEYLDKIISFLEEKDDAGLLEFEDINGIINIELDDGKQYVLNKHEASQEIWLSSPFSGAHHFKLTKDNNETKCISSNNLELFELLKKELEE